MAVLGSECPKNSTCTIKLLKNKSMSVKSDEFGRPYYSLENSQTKNTLLYTYSRIVKGNIQDAGYREEIVFELDKDGTPPPLVDGALQKTKMLYGRFCFCKGQTGYYKITKGNLSVATVSKRKTITLNLETTEVPQITKNISIIIK